MVRARKGEPMAGDRRLPIRSVPASDDAAQRARACIVALERWYCEDLRLQYTTANLNDPRR